MPRKLKVMNGRGDYGKFDGHLYVCAESKAEAARMLQKIGYGYNSTVNTILREINVYWHDGAWGNAMEELMPEDRREKSVWFAKTEETGHEAKIPVRLL